MHDAPSYDITVAITAHNETVIAGPTVRSCDAAITVAEAAGYRVQRLIGLDNATDATRRYFNQPALDHWRKIPLAVGDLGLARNALVLEAEGRMTAFMDADDLFSENWLVLGAQMLDQARAKNAKWIMHPEINWFFDAANAVLVNPDQDSDFYAPLYWRVGNCFDSLAMAQTSTFLEVPYRGGDAHGGYGYEDWAWNIQTIEAGFKHRTVRDTIIFKRRRDRSLMTELGDKNAVLWELDALAIDKLVALGQHAVDPHE